MALTSRESCPITPKYLNNNNKIRLSEVSDNHGKDLASYLTAETQDANDLLSLCKHNVKFIEVVDGLHKWDENRSKEDTKLL